MPETTSEPSDSACSKFSRTRLGSATPLNSTMMWLKGSPPSDAKLRRSKMDTRSSSPSEQHAHPFCNWIVSTLPPPSVFCCLTSLASIFTEATSLTTTPTLVSAFSSQCFSRVVLPVPKNPLSNMTGTWWPVWATSPPRACRAKRGEVGRAEERATLRWPAPRRRPRPQKAPHAATELCWPLCAATGDGGAALDANALDLRVATVAQPRLEAAEAPVAQQRALPARQQPHTARALLRTEPAAAGGAS
mmetsp:Transcript_23733/g.53491  ORF Transcript_23733/g.53491 Transcript_23733/m.53491 type:complete len:247 (-) Transcript_23733:86-826(-)